MIHAIIVDDETKSRQVLRHILQNYCPNVSLIAEAATIEQAVQIILKERPNVLFLDIEMRYGTSFDLLRQLPQYPYEIIFTSGFQSYALDAIKVQAIDYLLKPIDIKALLDALQKVEQKLKNTRQQQHLEQLLQHLQQEQTPKQDNKIRIPTTEGVTFVTIEDVIYCIAEGIYTWIVLNNNQKLLASKNLGFFEQNLTSNKQPFKHLFFRTHHKYLINTFYIKKYNRTENYIELQNGHKIDIAKRRKAAFLALLKI